MAIFMFIISILVFLVAVAASLSAKSSVHEIYGAVLGVVSAVFFIGAAIVEAITKHAATMGKLQAAVVINSKAREKSDTKYCRYCNAEISSTASVCPKCGKVI